MQAYLEQTIGVANATVRNNLVTSGFTSLEALVNLNEAFVTSACSNIRKAGGQVDTRNVPALVELRLKQLVIWCNYRYMVQRPLQYADATVAALTAIGNWASNGASRCQGLSRGRCLY